MYVFWHFRLASLVHDKLGAAGQQWRKRFQLNRPALRSSQSLAQLAFASNYRVLSVATRMQHNHHITMVKWPKDGWFRRLVFIYCIAYISLFTLKRTPPSLRCASWNGGRISHLIWRTGLTADGLEPITQELCDPLDNNNTRLRYHQQHRIHLVA